MPISRRTTLTLMGGLAALALVRPAQAAASFVDYDEAALRRLAEGGEPYVINFFATWCSTCAAQERVLNGLAGEDAAYAAIPILRVDWDQHSRGDLVRQLAIPRRSTLVMMRGTTELGRLVADTRRDAIAGLLDLAAS